MKTVLIAFGFLITFSVAASARCIVTDPTGTPLNIRAEPNGRVIGTLRNGTSVVIRDTVVDDRGRAWANVGIGWVFREFVTCY